jgi:glycyl-tRNA synthetase
VTYDFESATDGQVTVRERDSMDQERVSLDALQGYIRERLEERL